MLTTKIMIGLAAGTAVIPAFRMVMHRALLKGLAAPRVAHTHQPADFGVPPEQVREVTIAGSNGKDLFGWLIRPATAMSAGVPAAIVMHGWGSNASMMLEVAPPLMKSGRAALFIDARCHGNSDGEDFTSMPRFAEDLASAMEFLRNEPDIDPDRISLIGHSVGAGAVLLHAARHKDVCAVISLSAFAHPREVMRRWLAEYHIPYPVIGSFILRHVQHVIGTTFDAIAPINTISQIQCPVMVVHGRQDDTVPFDDALRLHAAARSGATMLEVDGHHDLRAALAPHAGELVDFLDAACRPQIAA